MKRLSFLLVILIIVFMTPITGYAERVKIIDEVEHARLDGEAYYFPGMVYTIPLTYGGTELDREFYNDYRLSIQIIEGEKYVDYCRMERQEDDTYALVFRSKKNFSSNYNRDVQIMITAQEKANPNRFGEVYLDIELGYGDGEDVTQRRHYINNLYPILDFENNLGKVTLVVENRAEIVFSSSGVRRKNMFYSVQENREVLQNNEDGALEFLSFPAKPEFPDIGATVRMDTVDGNYVYEITPEGLVDQNAVRDGNYLEFTTNVLSAYVISDIELRGLAPNASSTNTSTGNVPPEQPNNAGGTGTGGTTGNDYYYNPQTGGGEFDPTVEIYGGEGIIINQGDKYNPQTGI